MHERGHATTVLFLHGFGTTARMWDEHARLLPEFNVLAPDLPGHGSRSGRPWVSLEETAAEVARLIEASPEGRASVVGLSLGGAVAIELMRTRPELLDRVIVDGAAAVPWRFAPLVTLAAWLVSPFLHSRPYLRLVAEGLSIGPLRRPQFYREMRLVDPSSFRRSIGDAFRARLEETAFPRSVLLVAGERDAGATRVSNATLAARLPDAAAFYVPRTLHAWVATRPDLHRAMVRAFLLAEPLPAGLVPETSKARR